MRLVWLAPFIASCGVFSSSPERHSSSDTGYGGGGFHNQTQYRIVYDRVTPKGIQVDDPTNLLSSAQIDKMVDALEECIADLPAQWTQYEVIAGKCLDWPVPRNIRRDWIDVKVPPDWYYSECTGEALFPCEVDAKLCSDKPELGQYSEDPRCPCHCRGAIQGNRTIVTTPKANLFKGTLARLVTGCNLPWAIPALNECLKGL